MYNYKKSLPKGYRIEKKIVRGSSAEIFILINSDGKRMVRKISKVEGINKNGKEKLKNEIIFLEYFHQTKTMDFYPKIYAYECNNMYVYYDMEFIQGKTLQELLDENKITESLECCNKVLDDLCKFSDIKKDNFIDKNVELYKAYLNKTKKVIDKLLNDRNISYLIRKEKIKINSEIYSNAKMIIDYFYDIEIQKKLVSTINASCFHGDLISSNILYDHGKVNYIDPRGEFNNFDICYDVAKMKFSFSGYNQVINDKFIIEPFKEDINFMIEKNANSFVNEKFYTILRKNDKFSDIIIKQDGYWKERIRLHTALQYINNSYIHIKNGDVNKFKVMYGIGVIKLNELLNKM